MQLHLLLEEQLHILLEEMTGGDDVGNPEYTALIMANAPWYFQPVLQCHAMESPSSWCHVLLLPSVRPAAHHGLSALFFPKLRVFNRIPTAADSKHQILPAPVQLPTKFLILFSSSFFPHFALERAQSAHSFHQAHSSMKWAGGI